MPLIQPYLCSNLSKGFWSQLKKDRFFISQAQVLSSIIYPYAPYRIMIIQNGYVVSEASSEEESNQDWERIHQTLIDAKITLILKDTPYDESGKVLLNFFTGLYESDKANTNDQTKNQLSSSGTSSEDIFSFTNTQSQQYDETIETTIPPIFSPDNTEEEEEEEHDSEYKGEIDTYEMVSNVKEKCNTKKVSDDFIINGWIQKLKSPNLNTQKETNWIKRYFVLKTHILIEHTDEIESSFMLADSTGREMGRSWVSLISLSLSDTSTTSTNAFRPIAAAPGIVGYMFEFGSACDGGGKATLLAETVSDNIGWLEFLQRFAEARDTREMEREGSLYIDIGGGRWERRWIRIKDDKFEVHRREEKAVYPMASCTAVCDKGLDVTVKFKNESNNLVLRFTPDEWSSWLDALKYSARVSVASSSSISPSSSPSLPNDNKINVSNTNISHVNTTTAATVTATIKDTNGEADKEMIEIEKIISGALKLDETIKKRSPTTLPKSDNNTQKKRPYFILAVDGGGMRGVMIAVILERIVHEFPDLLDRVDLFTGTSIGAIISSVLAFGHSPTMCRALLEGTSRYIFSKRPDASFTGVLSSAKFSNKSLARVLKVLFGKSKIGQAHKKLIIPAFLLDTNSSTNYANLNDDIQSSTTTTTSLSTSLSSTDRGCDVRCMHNLKPAYKGEDTGAYVPVVDAVMRSAAAPTFFPSYQNFVDGGMFAQDPSSIALSYAMSPQRDIHKRPEDIVLLSIGTGKVRRYYEDPNGHDYGYVQWGPKILNVLWDAMVLKSIAVCRELLGDNYWRADPDLPREIPLDDRDQLPELVAEAQKMDLEPTFRWIRKYVYNESGDKKSVNNGSKSDGGNGDDEFVTRLRSLSTPYRKVK